MLWPGSPNHMISVMWICWSSEASGLRREVRPRHQPNFCWKISFSGWLWVTLRSLPYAYAPHTMIQYLADFAMVWILNANSWLAPVVGMELANRCWYCLSASVSVPQGQGPMFPVAQPLSFSWEIAFVLWGGGESRCGSFYSRDSLPKSREIHRAICCYRHGTVCEQLTESRGFVHSGSDRMLQTDG